MIPVQGESRAAVLEAVAALVIMILGSLLAFVGVAMWIGTGAGVAILGLAVFVIGYLIGRQ